LPSPGKETVQLASIDWEQEDAGSFLAPLQEASHGSFVVAGRFNAPSHVCKGHAQIF